MVAPRFAPMHRAAAQAAMEAVIGAAIEAAMGAALQDTVEEAVTEEGKGMTPNTVEEGQTQCTAGGEMASSDYHTCRRT